MIGKLSASDNSTWVSRGPGPRSATLDLTITVTSQWQESLMLAARDARQRTQDWITDYCFVATDLCFHMGGPPRYSRMTITHPPTTPSNRYLRLQVAPFSPSNFANNPVLPLASSTRRHPVEQTSHVRNVCTCTYPSGGPTPT